MSKKEYKEFYLPKDKPGIINVPAMNYLAVRGQGNPNAEGGEYKTSIELLYSVAYTIKMSKKGSRPIEGYFDYVVPPLEGFWEGYTDSAHKDNFRFVSVIRLPDFVTQADFDWSLEEATRKKQRDFSKVEFLTIEEGLCVQCLHVGSYDNEPATLARMHHYAQEQGFEVNITGSRWHHEIYLSDPRKCATEKLKTVIRLPLIKKGSTKDSVSNS